MGTIFCQTKLVKGARPFKTMIFGTHSHRSLDEIDTMSSRKVLVQHLGQQIWYKSFFLIGKKKEIHYVNYIFVLDMPTICCMQKTLFMKPKEPRCRGNLLSAEPRQCTPRARPSRPSTNFRQARHSHLHSATASSLHHFGTLGRKSRSSLSGW